MKRFVLFFLLCYSSSVAEPLNLTVHADKAVLINGKTGTILFEKEAFTPAYPASTTKIATAIYALHCKGEQLDHVVSVKAEALASISPQAKRDSNYRSPPHWLETDGSHISLKRGEELTLNQLLHALLISSANDAANTIAISTAGNVPKFMQEVNTYLKSIGCTQTEFNNPHGLHHPAHITTAYDLALMAKVGLEHPKFREIVGKVRHTCPKTNLEQERTFVQTNLLMRNGAYNYPKAIGVKTGGTQAAGKNLVAAAQDGDRLLIGVVLGCESRSEVYQDMLKMFEAAFNQTKMRRTLLPVGDRTLIRKVSSAQGKLKTILPDGLYYDFFPAEDEPIKAEIRWMLPQLPIRKGTQIGSVCVVNERDMVIQESPILAAADLRRAFWPWILIAVAVIISVVFIKQFKKGV